ncbi:MAG: proline--tRNA ligase [Myxococcaceae bacterium]|nr:proline--tRNA ligase [Myxococcaceae bacterium]
MTDQTASAGKKHDNLKLPTRAENFSEWYNELVHRAKLADHSDVRGSMVIRPNGYAIWENMQRVLDGMFKDTGHQNAYFPVLIPESYLAKEKKHVADFAPQVAVVTHAGGKPLPEGERFVIRPTSETIINRSFTNWVQSYRDLPILINQWANVMRWEMRPRLFLRTTEFLWQEGHTCHATEADATEETLKMLDVYERFAEDYMAVPVLKGQKTESEKFPGAVNTYSIEAMMQDKRALQAGTSHMLGQNFAKMFDTMYQSKEGKKEYVWQTSWGVSTRLIGALIMSHSDDAGLIVPPKLAPHHCVIIIIGKTPEERAKVKEKAFALAADMKKAGHRVFVDDDETKGPGFKYAEYELRGVCTRVELGPKDLEKNQAVLARRDTREKTPVQLEAVVAKLGETLEAMQRDLFQKAKSFRDAHTFEVNSWDELKARADDGFLLAHWDGTPETEKRIKDELGLTTRNRPFTLKQEPGVCVATGKPSAGRIVFAKAY